MRERERLDFVEKRDGKEAMLKFAEQTLNIYVCDAVEKSIYKDSVEELTKILKENGRIIRILVIDR